MSKDRTETDMIKMVNAQRDYDEIGNYIISEFYNMYDLKKAGEYKIDLTVEEFTKIKQYLTQKNRIEAQKLLRMTKMTKEEILAGKASFEIYKLICILQASFLSKKDVINEREIETKNREIELRTKKKQKEKRERIKKVLTAIGLSGVVVIGGLTATALYQNYKDDKEITSAIGYIVSEEENDKRNIVEQNTYRKGFDEKGKAIYDYNAEGIALDVISMCKKNPDFFDITLYNVYMNLDNTHRLRVMDDVIVHLKEMTATDESLSFIHSRLDNCRIFLDYLVNRGFLNPNSEDYYTVLNDIELYIETKGRGAIGFELLPEEAKNRLQEVINSFESNKFVLYDEYKDDVQEMAGEEFGTR